MENRKQNDKGEYIMSILNEMKELFCFYINHINLDYNNKLYKLDVETPFKK